MNKKPWAKGRKDATCLVRLDPDIYEKAKEQAYKEEMSLKAWISSLVRFKLAQL